MSIRMLRRKMTFFFADSSLCEEYDLLLRHASFSFVDSSLLSDTLLLFSASAISPTELEKNLYLSHLTHLCFHFFLMVCPLRLQPLYLRLCLRNGAFERPNPLIKVFKFFFFFTFLSSSMPDKSFW